ncbi:MAG TPA: hypothetical protein VG387_03970 [Rhizomicrobium sp.]|jgi:hypothetical protein|nr:hypothetical protein [Rhizomicrobium sp.]
MTAKFSEATFKSLYPGANTGAKGGTAIEYVSQDSEYRVYIPGKDDKKSTLKTENGDHLRVTLSQDHNIKGSTDDHSDTYLLFDGKGKLIELSHDFQISEGSAFQIPAWIPKALDIGVELLGAIGALETAGISEVVAQEVVADINSFCDTFNKIMTKLNKIGEDGGKLNFPAEICHNMNKASVSVAG